MNKKDIEVTTVGVKDTRKCRNSKCMKVIRHESADPTIKCANCQMKQLVKKVTTKKTTVLNAEDGTSFILHEPQLSF